MTFWGVYQLSCGPIPMIIRGNRPGGLPELPIQSKNKEFSGKTTITRFKTLFFFRQKGPLSVIDSMILIQQFRELFWVFCAKSTQKIALTKVLIVPKTTKTYKFYLEKVIFRFFSDKMF